MVLYTRTTIEFNTVNYAFMIDALNVNK